MFKKPAKPPPSEPLKTYLAIKPIDELYAINLLHLSSTLLESALCKTTQHKFDIIQTDYIISTKCKCNTPIFVEGNMHVMYNGLDNLVVFAKKSTLVKLFDSTRQYCKYVPKIKFGESIITLTCGHHTACKPIVFTTLGKIKLI